jgi:hypothetical protein
MNTLSQDLRKQTLDLVLAHAGNQAPAAQAAPVASLIDVWLASLDEEDLAGISPASLASALWPVFSRVQQRPPEGCQIDTVAYDDGRGGEATGLLIVNPDMPYLVDSIVMALRKMGVASRAVLNAVLSVQRDASGQITQATPARAATAPLESYVLCLLSEALDEVTLGALGASIRMVAGDAAAVHRDAAALEERMTGVAALAAANGTDEVSSHLVMPITAPCRTSANWCATRPAVVACCATPRIRCMTPAWPASPVSSIHSQRATTRCQWSRQMCNRPCIAICTLILLACAMSIPKAPCWENTALSDCSHALRLPLRWAACRLRAAASNRC